jgi:glucosamine 6-phosphate synthetase-like amidotransferase/phosphosugar isomerase protein
MKDHKMQDADTVTGITSVLLREAEKGGRSASGLSIMKAKSAHVLRRPLSGSALVNSKEYIDFMDKNLKLGEDEDPNDTINSIIGHCRMPTKGSEFENLNNHPLVIKHIIGVHNGIIINDDELFAAYRAYFTRLAKVDTEIIFQMIAMFCGNREVNTIEAIQKSATHLRGSFACAMQNANHPYNLYLFRASNPIRLLAFKKLGIIIFATREHFIKTALDTMLDGENNGDEIPILDQSGISINLYNRSFAKFILNKK